MGAVCPHTPEDIFEQKMKTSVLADVFRHIDGFPVLRHVSTMTDMEGGMTDSGKVAFLAHLGEVLAGIEAEGLL